MLDARSAGSESMLTTLCDAKFPRISTRVHRENEKHMLDLHAHRHVYSLYVLDTGDIS